VVVASAVSSLAALRLDLINQGLRVDEALVAAGFTLALSTDARTSDLAEGIDVILPGGWWTSVSIATTIAKSSPWVLGFSSRQADRLELRHRSRESIPVTLPDTSRFRHQRTPTGVSCGDIGAVHGRWVVIAPFASREPVGFDRPRRFLGIPPSRPLTKSQWSIDEVVACAQAAWRTAGVRLVHLEASHVLREDGGLADLAPYLHALKRALPTMISISVTPPVDAHLVLDLYAAGADSVSYHLLAWDEQAASLVTPLRSRFVSHRRILDALVAAARVFPRGAVSTDLLLGLEPLATVEHACSTLTELGIVPNLTVFRPLPGAEDHAPTSETMALEKILALTEKRYRLLQANQLARTCVRGFPRVLSGMDRYRPRLSDRCYASWRRQLRVVTS
jgi:hypothetical protein